MATMESDTFSHGLLKADAQKQLSTKIAITIHNFLSKIFTSSGDFLKGAQYLALRLLTVSMLTIEQFLQ